MTGLEDRQVAARNILMAHSDGARLHLRERGAQADTKVN